MEEFIRKEDLKTFAEVGRALWMDPRQCQVATMETLSAVTLLDLTPDRALEKAASALLDRVTKRGGAANFRSNLDAGLKIDQPFFRLLPEERFLLVALHLGRWSYARLSRISGHTVEEIETQAWSARLRFVSAEKGLTYPAGASLKGPHCPEYDQKRPWTQRFLDDEISSGREKAFLQNHLMACASCGEALNRCREAYYGIERALPRLAPQNPDDRGILRALESVSQRSLGIRRPVDRSVVESLLVFAQRSETQIVLGFLGLLAVWRVFFSH